MSVEQPFDEFVAEVEQAARAYVRPDDPSIRQTNRFRAQWLDLDADARRTGMALSRLQDENVVESVGTGYNSSTTWSFCDPDPTPDTKTEVRRPWDGSEYNSRQDWSDEYGVYGEFLPFAYHETFDPLPLLRKVTAFLSDRPAYCRQVSTSKLATEMGLTTHMGGTFSLDTFCLLSGWWRGGETSSGAYYCNPDYPHPFDDEALSVYGVDNREEMHERRIDLLNRAAKLGLSADVLCDAFGVVDKSAVYSWANQNGMPWDERRSTGRQKMARTWKTIASWDYTHREIAETFGRPRRTITEHINRFAGDFEPPTDPSYREVSR